MATAVLPNAAKDHRDAVTASLFARAERGAPAEREQALNRAIELNLPLAHAIAQRYSRLGAEPDDLHQVAALGLVKAAHRYNPAFGVPFGAFAVPTVRGEVLRHLRDSTHLIRAPRPVEERRLRLASVNGELTHELGRHATIEELAQRMLLSAAEVREALLASESRWPQSLDQPLGPGGDVTIGEVLGELDAATDAVEWSLTLARHIADLDPRDQQLLHLRFGEELTQVDIAQRMNVSQMQVSRLLQRVLNRLRTVLSRDDVAG